MFLCLKTAIFLQGHVRSRMKFAKTCYLYLTEIQLVSVAKSTYILFWEVSIYASLKVLFFKVIAVLFDEKRKVSTHKKFSSSEMILYPLTISFSSTTSHTTYFPKSTTFSTPKLMCFPSFCIFLLLVYLKMFWWYPIWNYLWIFRFKRLESESILKYQNILKVIQ